MKKKLIFRLSAILIGCTLILLILEMGLRIFYPQPTGPVQFGFDPDLGCIPVPLQKGIRTRPDYSFSNNSWGLRGARDYNREKKADLRIIVFGDSFTYGIGVDDEQVFTVLLEKNLAFPGRTVEVINAGVPGKGSDYALKFMQAHGKDLDADLVILCFNRTDFWDNERGDYYIFNSDGSLSVKTLSNSVCAKKVFLMRSPFYNWLIGWSHLANLVRKNLAANISRIEQIIDKKNQDRLVVVYPAGNRHNGEYDKAPTEMFLDLLTKETKKSSADLVVFYLGELFEVDRYRKEGKVSDCERDFQDILKGRDIVNFSTTATLANSGLAINNLYNINSGDYHFSANAHKLVADFMSDCLEKVLKEKLLNEMDRGLQERRGYYKVWKERYWSQ